ncbi:MAG: glycosyltransferase family 1 protein [Acidobacteriota bacterium]|nr:glycosyltransferase family 1 protein [Acidobacteriota bacterium]
MINVLFNALASTAGGGVTYLRNVLPLLSRTDVAQNYLALVPPTQLSEFAPLSNERMKVETVAIGGALKRMWWEQTGLRRLLKSESFNVLVSLGNFALLASPVPQILFNRNDLFFSEEFERDLQRRRLRSQLLAHQFKSWLARESIKQATVNVTPTEAFAERIRSCVKLKQDNIETLRFGFDAERFVANQQPLPETLLAKLDLRDGCRRVSFVSHYNYFRNFETLIRALPIIKSRLRQQTGEAVQLVLTTDIRRGAVYGGYDATAAAELIDRLAVREDIAMLGAVDYSHLHQLYKLCDVFVCPSYSESFGHPLVEAMASGVPVVSADLPVHREICGDAAVYFDVFDEMNLAERCVQVLADKNFSARLSKQGLERSQMFSWSGHVRQLTALIARVTEQNNR